MPITRTALIDDDGTGTTGTVLNNAWYQSFCDAIDALAVNPTSPPTARTDRSNTFTLFQEIKTSNAFLALNDINQPSGSRAFVLQDSGQLLTVSAMNDDYSSFITSGVLVLTRAGDAKVFRDLYEKGRTTPMGHWIDVPFSAANFAAGGGGTWTVAAGNVRQNAYTLIGKMLIWIADITNSTITGTPSNLTMTLPGGLIGAGGVQYNSVGFSDGAGAGIGMVQSIGTSQVNIYKNVSGGGWTASASAIIEFTAMLRVA